MAIVVEGRKEEESKFDKDPFSPGQMLFVTLAIVVGVGLILFFTFDLERMEQSRKARENPKKQAISYRTHAETMQTDFEAAHLRNR